MLLSSPALMNRLRFVSHHLSPDMKPCSASTRAAARAPEQEREHLSSSASTRAAARAPEQEREHLSSSASTRAAARAPEQEREHLSSSASTRAAARAPEQEREHLSSSASTRAAARASPDDVLIVHALRTAIGRAKRGSFKDTTPDELLSAVMSAVLKDVNLSPDKVGDTCVGNVLQPGAGALMARIAQFLSGFPETVPVCTVNRQCSSGLQALLNIAGGIRNGSYDLGLACGVESMSLRSVGNPGDLSSRLMDNEKARDCLIPMGITSENVAERYGVTREKQDSFACSSQQKAARAQKQGLFEQEIVPVTTKFVDENGKERTITVTKDDGIRPGTTLAGLAKLRPAFKEDGSTTAGNASQVSDGAAAVLLGRRSTVEALGLPVLGIFRAGAVVGVPPDVMGIGPAYAIPAALEKAGLTVDDVDVFEINEAFASQAVYCVDKLGIPMEKVNPNGGAIALGHPLGCTGARQVVTLLNELKRRGKRGFGVVSMCIGTGMGAAAVFEYPGP